MRQIKHIHAIKMLTYAEIFIYIDFFLITLSNSYSINLNNFRKIKKGKKFI